MMTQKFVPGGGPANLRDTINSAESKFTIEQRSNLDNESPMPGSKGELMRSHHPIRWADDNEEL